MNKDIKLVLSGGGDHYALHVGAVLKLTELGYNITELCGASGGALIAAALGTGYPPNELVSLIKKINQSKLLMAKFSLYKLFFKLGLISSNKIEKLLFAHLANTMGESRVPMHIVAVNVDNGGHFVFGSDNHAGQSMAKVVAASMAVPMLFTPVQINGHIYVDGSLSSNFPLDFFNNDDAQVIGLKLMHRPSLFKKVRGLKDLVMFVVSIVTGAFSMEAVSDNMSNNTILLFTDTKSSVFNTTNTEVDNMVLEGYKAVEQWHNHYE